MHLFPSLCGQKVTFGVLNPCLVVDNSETIELTFVLSSLSNWVEGGKSMFAVSRPPLGPRCPTAMSHCVVATDASWLLQSTPGWGGGTHPSGTRHTGVCGCRKSERRALLLEVCSPHVSSAQNGHHSHYYSITVTSSRVGLNTKGRSAVTMVTAVSALFKEALSQAAHEGTSSLPPGGPLTHTLCSKHRGRCHQPHV